MISKKGEVRHANDGPGKKAAVARGEPKETPNGTNGNSEERNSRISPADLARSVRGIPTEAPPAIRISDRTRTATKADGTKMRVVDANYSFLIQPNTDGAIDEPTGCKLAAKVINARLKGYGG